MLSSVRLGATVEGRGHNECVLGLSSLACGDSAPRVVSKSGITSRDKSHSACCLQDSAHMRATLRGQVLNGGNSGRRDG
jgi:hypothetical protein